MRSGTLQPNRVSTTPESHASSTSIAASSSLAGALLALAPWLAPLLVIATLTARTVNVPMFDEWTWAPLVLAMHDGHLRLADLWAQQQAHRSPLPTLAMLALASLDHWNVRIEALCSFAVAAVTLAMLATLTRRLPRARATLALIALVVFSLLQAENWMWGFQLSWFVVDACAVATIALLAAPRVRAPRLALAMVAALAASGSLVFGVGAWLAGALMLVGWRRALFAWCITAMVTIAVYTLGYHLPSFENGWAANAGPLDLPQFVLAYLGAPLGVAGGRWTSEAFGLAEIVGWIILARRAATWRPWLALAIFALIAAFFDGVGRSANGIDAALAFRYTTTSSLGLVALIGLAAQSFGAMAWRRFAVALAVLIALGDGIGYVYGYSLGGLQRDAAVAVAKLESVDDVELAEYANDPQMMRTLAQRLRAAHLGPFSTPAR